MDELKNRWIGLLIEGVMDGWMDEWLGEWMVGWWMVGLKEGWMGVALQ